MKTPILTLLLLVALLTSGARAATSPAQSGGPRVTAQLTTGVVKLGEVVSCVVQVEGAREARLLEVPEVDGLALERTSGPSVREQTSIIGGRTSFTRTLSWAVTFRPGRVGDYTLPPMRLEVDGKPMQTRELVLSVVEDLTGADLGHLEFLGVPPRVYEGQPFTVRLRFGWDEQIEDQVNVANLILPWWNELPGTLEVGESAPPVGARLVEVTVNNRARVRAVDLGRQPVRGRSFRVLELSRSFVATRSGQLDFPQSWLEFGHVRRRAFSEQRETYHVGTGAFSLEVRRLPEEGRPPEFSGGVGRFEVSAEVDRRDIDLGESLKLTVDWTGEANLEFFELPGPARLEAFADFRVYGTTNERFYGDRRRVVYDLAPKSADVLEVPPLPLSVFDPELGAYTVVETAPIPIRVRAIEGLESLEEEGADGGPPLAARDVQEPSEVAAELGAPPTGAVGGAFVALPLAWLAGRTAVRRRGRPDAPAARRRRGARRVLARDLRGARDAADEARAWSAFLAARTDEAVGAWEGRDARAWASVRGVELTDGALDELEAVQEELDRRRFAGGGEALEGARLLALADRLVKEDLR
jgi:hypothetical protein